MNYQTFSVRFECKKAKANKDGLAPVCIVITVNKEYSIIQTRQRQKPEDFKKLYSSRTINPIRTFCDNEKSAIQNIYSTLLAMPSITISSKLIKECYVNGIEHTLYNIEKTNPTLQQLFDKFKSQKTEEDVLPSTWKKYENAWNKFIELTEHKPTELATLVNQRDMQLFEARCYNTLHMQETTVKKMEKNIKAVFTFGVASNSLKYNPFGTIKIGKGEKEKPTEYLTYDEIQKLREVDIRSERLEKVRDMFFWQCFTGQNISDIAILEPEDIQFNGKQYYIQKQRYKRGKFGKKYIYTAVLFEDAIDVYKDYQGKIPYISPQKYNKYLKELMEMAGIKKHITTKCGRTTYACYLYNTLHIDIPIISKMMGHHSVKQTEEYLSIFDKTVFDAVTSYDKPSIEEEAEAWANQEPDTGVEEAIKLLYPEYFKK